MFYELLKLGVTIFVGFLGYHYKRYIKTLLFNGVLYGLKRVVLFYHYLNKKDDSIKPKKIVYIDDHHIIHEYEIVHNNKLHEMCFVSKKYDNEIVNEKLSKFNESKEEILLNRYKFLHCSIVDKDGNCIIDITNGIRAFVFYFDKDEYVCNIDHLLKYIVSKNPGLNKIEMDDHNILFYMNDDDFTEKVVDLKDKDVLLNKLVN